MVEEDLFRYLVELELRKAARLQYCVSVVYFTPDMPPGEADPDTTRRLAENATRRFRAGDVVASLPTAIGLLLVDAETQALPHIFDRTTEQLGHPRPLPSGEPGTWSGGASCYPLTAMTGAEMLRQASDLMAEATRAGGGRLCLPRTREVPA